MQNFYVDIGIFTSVMPLTSSSERDNVSTQALLLLCCVLFNANSYVQVAVLSVQRLIISVMFLYFCICMFYQCVGE